MKQYLSLTIQVDRDVKRAYLIDEPRSLSITYVEMTNTYVVCFKQYKKQMAVSCNHFNITGITYAKTKY